MWGSTLLSVMAWFIKIWLRCLLWILRLVLETCVYCTGIEFWGHRDHKQEPDELRCKKLKMEELTSQILSCPEILKAIFQNSDFYSLKTFRFVCKAWNREIYLSVAKREWQATVHERDLGDLKSLIESRRDALAPPFENIRLFTLRLPSPVTEQILGLLAKGLKITDICRISFTVTPPALQKDFQKLLIHLSTNLQKLHTQSFGDWSTFIPLNFPKLQRLCAINDGNSPDQSSFFLPIIAAAPKLTELDVRGGPLAKDILQQAKLKSLKTLYIRSDEDFINVNVWKLLGRADIGDLSFLSVTIGVDGYSGDDQDCIKTLSRFASSLTHLDIRRDRVRYGETHPPELPYLPYLTKLVLGYYSPRELDLRGLPRLRRLQFSHVIIPSTVNNDNQAGFSICPCVQSIWFMSSILKVNLEMATPQEEEAGFLDLFKRFPNAHTWDVDSGNVVNFCRAALSSGFRVSSLNIGNSIKDQTEEQFILEDRAMVSYVERLGDLEELMMSEKNCGIGRVEELDWKKLPKLKVLKIRSGFKNPPEHYRSITQHGLKVIIYGPQSVNGSEELLARKDVEFRVAKGTIGKEFDWLAEAIMDRRER